MVDAVTGTYFGRLFGGQSRPLDGATPLPGAYQGTTPLETARSSGRAAPTDQVSLSPEARLALAAQGPSAPKLLENLPDDLLDFDAMMQRAEARLAELMGEIGMAPGSDVTIRSDRAGHFTVESDHPKAAALESAINEDREMRNAMIGAETAAVIGRIAAATERAMQAADANPAMTERYYDWLLGVAKQAKATPFHFEMTGGTLTGGFTGAQGQALGLTDGLRLPG